MVAYFTRYSSLAALIAAAAAPVIHLVGWGGSGATVALLIMSGLLIWRHQANISKLLAGTESRIGQKTGSTPPSDAGAAPAATQPAAKRPHHSRHHPKRKSH